MLIVVDGAEHYTEDTEHENENFIMDYDLDEEDSDWSEYELPSVYDVLDTETAVQSALDADNTRSNNHPVLTTGEKIDTMLQGSNTFDKIKTAASIELPILVKEEQKLYYAKQIRADDTVTILSLFLVPIVLLICVIFLVKRMNKKWTERIATLLPVHQTDMKN